jgi:uncharacterized protein YdaU (DUF1376 family)
MEGLDMAEYPSFPFFVSDYLGKTQGELTLEQHGCYILLLAFSWQRPNCSLPDDDRWLAARLGIHGNKWRILRETVLNRFFVKDENGEYYSNRLRKERDFVEKSRRNAREKAEKRWAKERENNNLAKNQHMHPTPPHPKEERENDTSYHSHAVRNGGSGNLFEGIPNQAKPHPAEPLQGSAGEPRTRAQTPFKGSELAQAYVDRITAQNQNEGRESGARPEAATPPRIAPSSEAPIIEASPSRGSQAPPGAAAPPRPDATVVNLFGDAGGYAKPARPKSPKSKPKPVQDDAAFERFWSIYPRRDDKGLARKAWTEAINKASPEQIIAGAERYAAERAGMDPRYTKKPKTFLNAESWANEAPPARVIDQDGEPVIDGDGAPAPRHMNGQRMSAGSASSARKEQKLREAGYLR